MGLRSQVAISAGKTAQWVLKTFFKGGSENFRYISKRL